MGQRLVIDIKDFRGNCLANAYYHWSGYTDSALELTSVILNAHMDGDIKKKVEKERNQFDKVLYAVKLLEVTNAGLQAVKNGEDSKSELEVMQSRYPHIVFNKDKNRNDGLICVTEDEMDNSRNYEEAHVDIFIDSEVVDFYVFCDADDETISYNIWDDPDEIDEDVYNKKIQEYKDGLDDIGKTIGINPEEIPFDKFDEFSNAISNANHSFKINGDIYEKIE